MKEIRICPHAPLAETLAASSLVAPLFKALQVDCARCSMNKFCTLEDLCRHYGLELAEVSAALENLNAGFPAFPSRCQGGSPLQSSEGPKN